jgi:di/tricarboxylate transporter
MNVLWHSTGFPSGLSVFFVSSVFFLVRVTMVDKNKAFVCCLLATSAIMLSEKNKRKRKMWNKKWYLKRNISCNAHLLNELLETNAEDYTNYLRIDGVGR